MNKDWRYYFYKINEIPRGSGNEKEISKYVIDFAIERNLKYYTDKFYNVIIWKEATENCKNDEIIGLQAHMDMVCEKTKESNHDFFKDTIEIIEENGLFKAKDTTLGADNGIGVAYLLAILDSTEIQHPKLEAIFTTQEETTMNGVKNIDENEILSKKIISFDNFNEKEMWIGSASSQEWYTRIVGKIIKNENIKTYKLSLSNFTGGHSGMDIGDGRRGNPIKVAGDILKECNLCINHISGGTLINVIPRDCEIVFSINTNELDTINQILENIKKQKIKYNVEKIELNEIVPQSNMLDIDASKKVIECINNLENGAIYRDDDGNVVVGANLSKVEFDTDNVKINFAVRGNRRKLTDNYIERLKQNIIEKYELTIDQYDEWCGYEQPVDNELIEVCKKIYIEETNEVPNILGVQACLECEFLGKKIRDLQYIALGVNIYDAHSVKERMETDSAEKMWGIFIKIMNYYYKK